MIWRFEQSKELEDAATPAVEQEEAERTLEDADEEDEEEAGRDRVEEMQELLEEIERNMQRTNGRLDDALLNKLAKQLDKRSRFESLSIQISANNCRDFVRRTCVRAGNG